MEKPAKESKTCKGCRYWKDQSSGSFYGFDAPEDWGICGAAPMLCDLMEWRLPEGATSYQDGKRVIKEEYAGTKFAVMDGSSYRADLYTAPDFFCAMFKA